MMMVLNLAITHAPTLQWTASMVSGIPSYSAEVVVWSVFLHVGMVALARRVGGIAWGVSRVDGKWQNEGGVLAMARCNKLT